MLLAALARADDPPVEPVPEDKQRLADRIVAELMENWMPRLSDDDAARRAEAQRELRKRIEDIVAGGRSPVVVSEGSTVRIVLGGRTSETMSGSFEKDGNRGTYSLQSEGGGRYRLKATVRNTDGSPSEEFRDEGTLKELRARHAFLRDSAVFMLPDFFDPISPDTTESPLFGVVVHPPTDELRHHLALPEGAGLVVERVMPDSRAEEMGLKQYDVLLRIDGNLIDTPAQVKRLLARKGVLEIVRRAKVQTIDLSK
jgi:hypothetical protein